MKKPSITAKVNPRSELDAKVRVEAIYDAERRLVLLGKGSVEDGIERLGQNTRREDYGPSTGSFAIISRCEELLEES
jgi:hypothetical protein